MHLFLCDEPCLAIVWIALIEEVSDDVITSLVPGATLNDKGQMINDKWSYGRWFDLQGRPVNEKYIKNHRQLNISNGKLRIER